MEKTLAFLLIVTNVVWFTHFYKAEDPNSGSTFELQCKAYKESIIMIRHAEKYHDTVLMSFATDIQNKLLSWQNPEHFATVCPK